MYQNKSKLRDSKINKRVVNEAEILEFIQKNPYKKFLDIVKTLKIPGFLNKDVSKTLRDLSSQNKIDSTKNEEYYALEFLQTLQTKISITPKRLGFIDFDEDTENPKSAFLAPFQLKAALNEDIVEADIFLLFI
ncbi:hypothetical protein [Mycoplasma struthionis]|uniref:hypothetical protein n=1 Tax=Mycoplasma struthionis TaxID=538220 RepID=UPI0021BD45AB|nr:hypothetical protein [Mycoplasma struthionis]